MDFSHYIIKSSQFTVYDTKLMLKYIMRIMQRIIKCEQDISRINYDHGESNVFIPYHQTALASNIRVLINGLRP